MSRLYISALNSLVSNKSIREDILNDIYVTLKSLNSIRTDVKFSWTPAHTGIKEMK